MLKTLGAAFELKELTDAGTFEGLASVYGNIDLGGDIVEPGAFKSMELTKDGCVRILDGHSMRAPIGKGKLTDTHLGLAMKGTLNLAVARAREVHALMKDGIYDGLSIGYEVMANGATVDDSGVRHLTALKLWEVSCTPFPMNQAAQVSAVKEIEQCRSVRDIEDLLRDAVGLSRSQAKMHAGAIWKSVSAPRDAEEESGDDVLHRITAYLKSQVVSETPSYRFY